MLNRNSLDIPTKGPGDGSNSSLPIIDEGKQLSIQKLDDDQDESTQLFTAISGSDGNGQPLTINEDDIVLHSRQESIISSTDPSVVDDLSLIDSSFPTPKTQTTSRFKHQRNFSDISYSSYMPNVDESGYSLGYNKTSESTVSPLGKNSSFELVQNMNYNRKATNTGLLSLYSSSATVNLRGPTTRDIPATQLSKITKVKSSQFKPYINSIERSYKKFQSNKTLTESTLEAFMNQLNEEEKKNRVEASLDSNVIITEEEEFKMDSNSLTNIPEIYFSEDFRLDDPRVFAEVTENSTILKETTDFNDDGVRKPLIDNSQLQDKLSSFLDIIEIHLIHEISKSSGSFFSALDDLKTITKKSKDLTIKLKSMDFKLDVLEKNQVDVALDILKLTQKRNNTEKLEQALLQIYSIMHQSDLAEASYFNANYEKALELTDSVFALIRGNNPPHPIIDKLTEKWPYPLLDMNRIPALTPLKKLLMNMVADTGKSYAKLFVDFLIDDLRDHYENVPKEDTIERLKSTYSRSRSNKGPPLNLKYQQLDSHFKSQLKEFTTGLTRCGELVSAFKLYEEKFLAELKTIIRSNLPSDILELRGQSGTSVSGRSDDTRSTSTQQGGANGLSNNVKAMTPKEFEDMLLNIYTQLSEALRRLTIHKKLLLDMALDSLTATDAHLMDNQPDLIIQLDITNAITNAIEVTQRRMAKLINVREVQNASVSLDYFLRFYSINVMLLTECELISGGNSVTSILQDIINIQFQKFSTQFHKTSMKILSDKIEKELWKHCMIPSSAQVLLNEIVEASNDDFNIDKWMEPVNILGSHRLIEKGPEAEDRKTLMISGKSIIVPEVAASIMKLIQSYEIVKLQFPNSDNNGILELLRLLNLKVHQSVLGAQATRTAGLKHITSKHLAVASQFLDFMSTLTPYIKSLFNRLTKSDKFKSEEFDRIEQLFDDHKTEIFNKLVSIMTDRVNIHANEIKTTDWSILLPQQQAHSYMETLIKETLTIARVLQRYLPENQYSMILSKIFDQYKRSLISIFSQVRLKDSIDKAVMMKDIDYFREKLADVTGYGNSGQVIWENVNSLTTEEDTIMEQRMRSNILSENASANNSRSVSSAPKSPLSSERSSHEISREPSVSLSTPEPAQSTEQVNDLPAEVAKTLPPIPILTVEPATSTNEASDLELEIPVEEQKTEIVSGEEDAVDIAPQEQKTENSMEEDKTEAIAEEKKIETIAEEENAEVMVEDENSHTASEDTLEKRNGEAFEKEDDATVAIPDDTRADSIAEKENSPDITPEEPEEENTETAVDDASLKESVGEITSGNNAEQVMSEKDAENTVFEESNEKALADTVEVVTDESSVEPSSTVITSEVDNELPLEDTNNLESTKPIEESTLTELATENGSEEVSSGQNTEKKTSGEADGEKEEEPVAITSSLDVKEAVSQEVEEDSG